MKTICHISSLHSRYDVRIFKKECKTLVENGYDVYYVVNDTQDNECLDGIKIISLKYSKQRFFKRVFLTNRKLVKLALNTKADVYHIHDPELLLHLKKLKKNGSKLIFDSHEFYKIQILNKYYIPKFLRRIVAISYCKFEERVLRKIDGLIIPCTINGSNPFEYLNINTVIIGNFPRLHEFYSKYKQKEINNKAIYVGSISDARGVINNIVATHTANWQFILAGKFISHKLYKKTIEMVEFSAVEYHGEVNNACIPELISECSIGLSTLRNIGQYALGDNFPTKVYEYMSLGLPVIISKTPYVDRIMEYKRFGIIVNSEDINEVVDALKLIENNWELYQIYSNNARYLIKEYFNWEKEEKKLLDFYSKLMKNI